MGTIEVAKQLISAVVGGMTTYNQVIDKVLMRLDREEHDLSCCQEYMHLTPLINLLICISTPCVCPLHNKIRR
jgi:hypothetical protein